MSGLKMPADLQFYKYLLYQGGYQQASAIDVANIIVANNHLKDDDLFDLEKITTTKRLNRSTENAMKDYNEYVKSKMDSSMDSDTDSYYTAGDDGEAPEPRQSFLSLSTHLMPRLDVKPNPKKAKFKSMITTTPKIPLEQDEPELPLDIPKLLVMPAQGGKTSVIIEHVLQDCKKLATRIPKRHHVVVFVSDKNLSLNEQNRLRLDQAAKGRKVKSLASKYERGQGYKDVGTVLKNISDIDFLCCCHHSTRWQDIKVIGEAAGRKYTMSLVIDECDATATSDSSITTIKELIDNESVIDIYMMTATPTEKLMETYRNVELIRVLRPVHEKYVTLETMFHDELPDPLPGYEFVSVGYVAAVLSNRAPAPGETWFIPAETKVASHCEMRDMAFEHAFNIVILINGKEKNVTIQDDIDIEISPEHYGVTEIKSWQEGRMELKDIIANIHNTYPDLSIAITGNLCESRGITLQSVSCMIDVGVFSPACASSEEAKYQLFGRMLGPVKTFNSWKEGRRPRIFCRATCFEEVKKRERFVMNICERSVVPNTVLDRSLFKELLANSVESDGGKMSFDFWMNNIYKYNSRYLTKVTIKNYMDAVRNHSHQKVDGIFPDNIIDQFDAKRSDKKQISNAMRRYNEYFLSI